MRAKKSRARRTRVKVTTLTLDEHAIQASIPSDRLADMRRLLVQFESIRAAIEPIAQYTLVVDANILLADIIWLLAKRQKPDARTALHECVAAGTFTLFTTRQVIEEVEEKLPDRAAKNNLTHDACLAEWSRYKMMLSVRDADMTLTGKYALGIDPDDAPTLALAEELGADGILSKDKHIKAMGGTPVPIEFCFAARAYSRKMAVSVSIRVGGHLFVLGTVRAVEQALIAIRGAYAAIRTLPDWAKLLALVALIVAVLHPKSRQQLLAALSTMATVLGQSLPAILQMVGELAELEARNRAAVPTIGTT
jgi:predicted nucleic acid-binding protein